MRYIVYAKGGSSMVSGKGAAAYIVTDDMNNVVAKNVFLCHGETVNRTQLRAMIAGFMHVPKDATNIRLVSDSDYVINTLEGLWVRNANRDLFRCWEYTRGKREGVIYEFKKMGDKVPEEHIVNCKEMCNAWAGTELFAGYRSYKYVNVS